MEESWFSVRCLFKHQKRDDMSKHNLYEERITLWKAKSSNEVIEMAEEEAEGYARDTNSEFIGLSQLYHLYDEEIKNGSEVFSLMREHNYSPDKYLDRYFDTGLERQQDYDE